MALALSGCDLTSKIDKVATGDNAKTACIKRRLVLENVEYFLTKTQVTCVDPSTLEFIKLNIHNVQRSQQK
jgi:hypothetical protein